MLAPYVHQIRRNRLRARHEGKVIRARVRRDGTITVWGAPGRKFNSPSMAAIHVLHRNQNRWNFWQYPRRAASDRRKDQLLHHGGIRVLRERCQAAYDVQLIRERIERAVG